MITLTPVAMQVCGTRGHGMSRSVVTSKPQISSAARRETHIVAGMMSNSSKDRVLTPKSSSSAATKPRSKLDIERERLLRETSTDGNELPEIEFVDPIPPSTKQYKS